MNKEVAVKLNPTNFPSQFMSDTQKTSDEFGLQIGQAIQHEWFKKDGNNCRFYSQWQEFNKLRLYARGEQSPQKYKNELSVDGDMSYLNLDWSIVPVIPKFVDIVVNGMSDRLFKVKAYAQDAMSQTKRSNHQDMIESQMVAKPILEKIQEKTGANPFVVDSDTLPEDDEGLSLYMQIKYKPAIEIAEEVAVNTVMDENNYNELRQRTDYDQTVLGISVAKHEFLLGSGVKLSYVDPSSWVHSYTEDPYFRDLFYNGEVKTVNINEIRKINPNITDEQLLEISAAGDAWSSYHQTSQFYGNDALSKGVVTLLYFEYKTTKTFVYKKAVSETGNKKMIRKDQDFNPPAEMQEERGFEKVEKTIDIFYDGVMVLGTDFLLKWAASENMVRPKSSSQHAKSTYIATAPRMYKGVIESIVRRMIPHADMIQNTSLKLQQVIAKVVPDGVFIDADGLNEIDLGNGSAYNPEDALKLYFQTGSVIGRSYTGEGEFNHARIPIQELNSSSGASKTQMLVGVYNHYLNMMRDATGLNEARDASTPNPNALVGIQKLAALSSNTATRHILDSGLFMFKSMAEAVAVRISDILEHSDFKEDFANKIGKYNVGILEEISELYLYDFGIFIEISPDEEERAQLEGNIQAALAKENIDLEDAIDIREQRNLKIANQLLKVKRKAKQERDSQNAREMEAMRAQTQANSQRLAAEASANKIKMEAEAKMMVKNSEHDGDIRKLHEEAGLKRELMDHEFDLQMQLKGAEDKAANQKESLKENAKSERISQQNSEQSKLIKQRTDNSPAIDFESNEDSLDGLDFSEFEPR
jgi:hypothetical protein